MKDYKLPSGSIPRHIREQADQAFSFACWVTFGGMLILAIGMPLIVAILTMKYGVSWQPTGK